MARVEHPMQALSAFLPESSFEDVVKYLHHYKVHLSVTKARSTVLGDYRNAANGKNHRISVNGNLNQYAFLITLIHELAHLLTFEKYKHTVNAHGKEWKKLYSEMLIVFAQKNIFPDDIKKALATPIEHSCDAPFNCGI